MVKGRGNTVRQFCSDPKKPRQIDAFGESGGTKMGFGPASFTIPTLDPAQRTGNAPTGGSPPDPTDLAIAVTPRLSRQIGHKTMFGNRRLDHPPFPALLPVAGD